MLPPLPSDGPLTKVCLELSMGTDLSRAAECTAAFYEEMLAKGTGPTSTKIVLAFRDQTAPFPLLAMTTNSTVIILHGVKQLVIPYGHTHPCKGKMIGFLSDTNLGYRVPPIIKLETRDFNDAKP